MTIFFDLVNTKCNKTTLTCHRQCCTVEMAKKVTCIVVLVIRSRQVLVLLKATH